MALPIGTQAPDFSLMSTNGREFNLYRSMSGSPCILYFYPKDFTRGCTKEACGFRDEFALFRDLDISIVGISRDDIPTHLNFKAKLELPFHLLSDARGKVSRLYKATPPLLPFFTSRITYLLDHRQVITAVYENFFSAQDHIKTMIQQVKSMNLQG